MIGRLRDELGFEHVEYLEFPQEGHGGFPRWVRELALAKLFGAGPAPRVEHFRYRSAHLRHDRAWWLRLDRLDSPVRFAEVEAELGDGNARIKTDNVSALTVLVTEAPKQVRTVGVDGVEFPVPEHAATLSLEKWRGRWRVASADGLLKRKGLSGPISDVFRNRFLLVYGTIGQSELRRTISLREAQRFSNEWARRYGDGPRMKEDVDVTERDIHLCDLVLFGGPAVNDVSRRVVGGLPVTIGDDGIKLRGRLYDHPSAGLLICYPNPLNRNRMIVMAAANSPWALYQAFDRFGLWFNWGIYDKYKWFDYGLYDGWTIGPGTFQEVGFFDNRWQLPDEGDAPAGGGVAFRVDAEEARRAALQEFPRYASLDDVPEGPLLLSDLLPTRIDQYRGAVGINRSYAGRRIRLGDKPFDHGLGVKVPSSISWKLDGRFEHFTATVGLMHGFKGEPRPARTATEEVIFEVWGDGELLAATRPLNWKEGGKNWTAIEAEVRKKRVVKLVARAKSGATWLYGAAAWGAPTVMP